jgi:hypothetical protein
MWRTKTQRQRVVLIVTVVLVFLLLAHPELRLLAPLVDALGVDMLLLLVASQLQEYLRPSISQFGHYSMLAVMFLYALCVYLLGVIGPYVDGYLRTAFRRRTGGVRPIGGVYPSILQAHGPGARLN